MTADGDVADTPPEAQLGALIDRLDPKLRTLVRSVRAALRKRFPSANELAYDYTTHLVISYSPTERGIDAVVALAARDGGVSLYFNQGPRLPDPRGLLQGSGKQTRFIVVDAASRLAHPHVEALIVAATALAALPMAAAGPGRLVVKSGAAAKRARKAAS